MTPDPTYIVLAAGRVLLGGWFVLAGLEHFRPKITTAAATMMQARGVPSAKLVLYAASVFEITAGLIFISGYFTIWAGAALIAFTFAASILMLDFWRLTGAERAAAITNWKSNMAVVGGLLAAIAGAI